MYTTWRVEAPPNAHLARRPCIQRCAPTGSASGQAYRTSRDGPIGGRCFLEVLEEVTHTKILKAQTLNTHGACPRPV